MTIFIQDYFFKNIALIILLTVSGQLLATNTQDSDQISYSIDISENDPNVAKVEVSMTLVDGLLYMSHKGAGKLPRRWATFVDNIRVVNSTGGQISIKEVDGAKWQLSASEGERVTLRYDLKLDHESHEWSGGIDGAAYATDWGVFYTGRSLFIMNGSDRKNIRVNFNIPSSWKVTTPWQPVNRTRSDFIAQNQIQLSEGLIFAGTHEEMLFNRDGFELLFALGGEQIIAQKEDFRNLAEGVLDYYIELMGGIPNPSPDNQFERVVVIMNSSSASTDGEVIGNNISILLQEDGGQMANVISRFIFAHEFFHLWNGHSFSPEGQDCEWFKEGFTNYYTLKALRSVGFFTDEAFLEVLNSFFYQRYSHDSGIGTLSMTMGEEKHAHWGLIYGGGLFVGISQDLIVREATNNEKSIDDLMRSLFEKYGGTNEGYSLDELIVAFSRLSTIDQTEFFDEYVIGAKVVPIVEHLKKAGFDSKIEEGNLKINKQESSTPLQKRIANGLFGQEP